MIDYFFSGDQYIRVTRGDTGPGTVDPGYPAPISNWGWGEFGKTGIDAALFSGSKCFFFKDAQYIRVSYVLLSHKGGQISLDTCIDVVNRLHAACSGQVPWTQAIQNLSPIGAGVHLVPTALMQLSGVVMFASSSKGANISRFDAEVMSTWGQLT
jgi:hypothetical protein